MFLFCSRSQAVSKGVDAINGPWLIPNAAASFRLTFTRLKCWNGSSLRALLPAKRHPDGDGDAHQARHSDGVFAK